MRRPLLLTGLVAALTLLPATAALAHPSFNPNQVPAGEPVDAVLVVPHGCSTGDEVMPEEGRAVPTTRFDLQVVDGVTIEPGEVDGWQAEDDGEAIVWTADGGATTDPIEFPVTLTVEGDPGDELALAAFQECEDGSSYRWTEGSDSTPAVVLELTAGATGNDDVDMEGTDHVAGGTEGMGGVPEEGTGDATDIATEEAATEDATAAATEAGDGGIDGATVAALLAILVAVTAGIVSLVRRKGTA